MQIELYKNKNGTFRIHAKGHLKSNKVEEKNIEEKTGNPLILHYLEISIGCFDFILDDQYS